MIINSIIQPYLAIKTLLQLLDDEISVFSDTAEVLHKQTFVVDILMGSVSIVFAMNLLNQCIELLASGGFFLRKWSVNQSALFQDAEC